MTFWRDVIAKNRTGRNECFDGCLLLIGDKGIVKYPFKYAIVDKRKYTASISGLPGEFIEPSETIYTSKVDIPFSKGCAIKLNDKSCMTVTDIETEMDENARKIIGLTIYLRGGVPSEFGGYSN